MYKHKSFKNALNTDFYNYKVVKQFILMTIVWGLLGMMIGILIAAELIWPDLNFGISWLSFGRLRPLHTNIVIFGFGVSCLIGTSFYIVQRTCQVKLAFEWLASFVFWGWQLIIVLAIITLPQGITTSKEYAELEWPIAILVTIVWISYAIVFFATIAKRKIAYIYVANWFYVAFILAISLLHIVNHLAIPVTLFKSYSIYPGTIDAMIQWWYGHNTIGFILTVGFLGMIYYFIPIQIERPIYSYRLSVIHFWSLIGIYMWGGSHHLHYTALPDWTQTLGMVFSLMLIGPSWGGMINGIMTFSGAWFKLRTDPILRFLLICLIFYGMTTFEGSFMAIKTVNSLSHNTDWTVAHAHSGALGWVSLITIGSIYILIPRLFNKKTMFSINLIKMHFWLAISGTILYVTAMWVSGIMQGLMYRTIDEDGTLTYTFIEIIMSTHPFYILRLCGGILFLSGMFVMLYNIFMTIKNKKNINKLPKGTDT